MTSNFIRSLTVCSFSTFLLVASTNAADFGAYGSAPPSLDFPTTGFGMSDKEIRQEATLDEKKNTWIRQELSYLSPNDPFPEQSIAPVDPLTRKRVDAVAVGPAFKGRGYANGFDYYRYITFYNITTRKERFYELMVQRAECYEKSDFFANYTSTKAYTATVTASVSIDGLGFGATFTQTTTLGTGHGVTATGGIEADYIPYILFQDWNGQTYIQLFSSKTGKTQLMTKEQKESAWWVYTLFPLLAHEKYPMDFQIQGADRTFLVDRKIIRTCDTSFGAM